MEHWAAGYIGEPYIKGVHDCWGFARRVWREQFGLDVPVVDYDPDHKMSWARAFTQAEERRHWAQVDQPQDGDGALMGHGRHPFHVGVWVDGGVLHCLEGIGVLYQSLQSLQLAGWSNFTFYRRSPCAPR